MSVSLIALILLASLTARRSLDLADHPPDRLSASSALVNAYFADLPISLIFTDPLDSSLIA